MTENKAAAPASQVGKAAARQATRNAGSVTGLLEKKESKAPASAAPVAPAAKATVPTVACGCGCGAQANPGRLYRPGHDAKHAGAVGRALAAKAPGAEEAASALPAALEAKARAFAANRAKEAKAKEARAQVRAEAKAALEAALAAL